MRQRTILTTETTPPPVVIVLDWPHIDGEAAEGRVRLQGEGIQVDIRPDPATRKELARAILAAARQQLQPGR